MGRRYVPMLVFALCVVPISGVAQSDRTDEFIRAEMERQNIPGLSLVVLRNGEIIKARGYGFANIEEQVRTDAEVIESAYDLPLRFAPGERSEYSNLGYFVLAEVITRAAGRPWTEYLRDTIFEPLGMDATHPTNTAVTVPERARGYVDNDELRHAPEWPALRPSGGFLSTVSDFARWDAALYTDRILGDATRRRMWTRVTLADGSVAPYGLGWSFGDLGDRKLVYHTGGMPGARAAFARFVDEGLTIIMLMNLDDVDIGTILFGVARLYPAVTSAMPDVSRQGGAASLRPLRVPASLELRRVSA